MKPFFLLLAVCLIGVNVMAQTDGFADSSLNSKGWLSIENPGSTTVTRKVIVQPDQKILVGGTCRIKRYDTGPLADSCYVAVIRYLPDGALDSAFGVNGTAIIDSVPTSPNIWNMAMVLQPDGKILIVSPEAAARLDSSGNPDRGFGAGGRRRFPLLHSSLPGKIGLALQPDGRYLVAHSARFVSGGYLVSRFQSNGDADSSFGNHGTDTLRFPLPVQATDIAVQADGKILCTGGLVNFNVQTIAFRLLQNGGIDSAFGQNGHALCVNNAYCHSKSGGEAIVIQPDGRFIIGGNLFLASGLHMTAVRYSSNGIPDSSFGSNGICRVGPNGLNGVLDMKLQPDGKLLACGIISQGSQTFYALARITAAGQPDSSFGNAGIVMDTAELGSSLDIDAKGRVYVGVQPVGMFRDPKPFRIQSFDSNGAPNMAFGTSGAQMSAVGHQSSDELAQVIPLPDHKMLFGGTMDISVILSRRFPDGGLDSSFGEHGVVRLGPFVAPGYTTRPFRFVGMARHPNGKVYLAYRQDFYDSVFVARYLPNGQPDLSYGDAGTARSHFFNPRQILLQPDAKLLVAGHYPRFDFDSLQVIRFRSNGTPDRGFGGSGMAAIGFPGCNRIDPGNMIGLLNGRILIAVVAGEPGGNDFIGMVTLQPDGRRDTTFGTGGQLQIQPLNPGTDLYNYYGRVSVQEADSGKLLITAESHRGAFISRLDAACRKDSSFGLNGIVYSPLRPIAGPFAVYHPASLIVQSDQKVILGHHHSLWDSNKSQFSIDSVRFAAVRFRPDGSVDSAFGIDGMASSRFFGRGSAIGCMVLAYDGKLLAGGWANGPYTRDMAVARYHTGLPPIDTPVDLGESADTLDLPPLGLMASPASHAAVFYPNPMMESGTLAYSLQSRGIVRVSLYDQSGRMIDNLHYGDELPGRHKVAVPMPPGAPSGTYLLMLETPAGRTVFKVVKK